MPFLCQDLREVLWKTFLKLVSPVLGIWRSSTVSVFVPLVCCFVLPGTMFLPSLAFQTLSPSIPPTYFVSSQPTFLSFHPSSCLHSSSPLVPLTWRSFISNVPLTSSGHVSRVYVLKLQMRWDSLRSLVCPGSSNLIPKGSKVCPHLQKALIDCDTSSCYAACSAAFHNLLFHIHHLLQKEDSHASFRLQSVAKTC